MPADGAPAVFLDRDGTLMEDVGYPRDPADGNKDLNGDGYTNLEKYLNGTDPTKFVDYRKPENNKNTLTAASLRAPKK